MATEEFGDDIDSYTFQQILQMDEPENDEFSKGVISDGLRQLESFLNSVEEDMQAQISRDELLKRVATPARAAESAAYTLGAMKVGDAWKKLQRLGRRRDPEDDNSDHLDYGYDFEGDGSDVHLDPEDCLARIRQILPGLRDDFAVVKRKLRGFLHEDN